MLSLGLIAIVFMATGCGGDGSSSIIVTDEVVTFINDTDYAIVIDPFDAALSSGGVVDIEIGNDIVYVVVFRQFDGLILLETDVAAGDVWVIQ